MKKYEFIVSRKAICEYRQRLCIEAGSEEEARRILNDACDTDEDIRTGDECGRITVLDEEVWIGNYDLNDYSIL